MGLRRHFCVVEVVRYCGYAGIPKGSAIAIPVMPTRRSTTSDARLMAESNPNRTAPAYLTTSPPMVVGRKLEANSMAKVRRRDWRGVIPVPAECISTCQRPATARRETITRTSATTNRHQAICCSGSCDRLPALLAQQIDEQTDCQQCTKPTQPGGVSFFCCTLARWCVCLNGQVFAQVTSPPRRFRSASTIISANPSKSTLGVQPSDWRTLVESATSRSTSAGRINRGSWTT